MSWHKLENKHANLNVKQKVDLFSRRDDHANFLNCNASMYVHYSCTPPFSSLVSILHTVQKKKKNRIRHELLAYMSICHTIEYVHIETNNFAI